MSHIVHKMLLLKKLNFHWIVKFMYIMLQMNLFKEFSNVTIMKENHIIDLCLFKNFKILKSYFNNQLLIKKHFTRKSKIFKYSKNHEGALILDFEL